MQEDPGPSCEIEDAETEIPIPSWLRLLDVEAAALMEDPE
jgi:hypothetical protein